MPQFYIIDGDSVMICDRPLAQQNCHIDRRGLGLLPLSAGH